MKGLIEITNDLFDIAWQLKTVDENYTLYYNAVLDRYEVHDSSQRPSTLAFVVPYDEVDARTVDFARYTRVERAKQLFDEVEKHNARIQAQQQRLAVEQACEKLEEAV